MAKHERLLRSRQSVAEAVTRKIMEANDSSSEALTRLDIALEDSGISLKRAKTENNAKQNAILTARSDIRALRISDRIVILTYCGHVFAHLLMTSDLTGISLPHVNFLLLIVRGLSDVISDSYSNSLSNSFYIFF